MEQYYSSKSVKGPVTVSNLLILCRAIESKRSALLALSVLCAHETLRRFSVHLLQQKGDEQPKTLEDQSAKQIREDS